MAKSLRSISDHLRDIVADRRMRETLDDKGKGAVGGGLGFWSAVDYSIVKVKKQRKQESTNA